jgi:phage terminase large subunit
LPSPAVAIDQARKPYQPRGAALDLWKCRADEVLMSGPAGTGKTRAGLEKVHASLLRWPGARACLVRKTRKSLTETALVTYERDVAIDGVPPTSDNLRRVRQSYRYPNGSELIVGGLDNIDSIMSGEYDLIYIVEAIEASEQEWEKLTTRLRNGVMPFQQLLADCNPSTPLHWLKRRCDAGRTVELVSRHKDNPVYWDVKRGDWTDKGRVYVEGKLKALSGVLHERLYKGIWAAAEGLVYGGFDPAVHLVDRSTLPAFRRWVVSIDFGFTNPAAIQFWGIDGDGRMYLVREIYRTKTIVSDLAKEMKKVLRALRIRNYEVVADHDAEDRATLARCGLATRKARKAIKPGIQAVEERIRVAGDGRPRLYICRDALVDRDEELVEAALPHSTEQELASYCWQKGKDGKPNKEEPEDLHNHGMDAMRYAVMHIDRKTPEGGRRVAASY